MKKVRALAIILYYISRTFATIFIAISCYAIIAVILYEANVNSAPIAVDNDHVFRIFYPFTTQPFLLGEYTNSYLIPVFTTLIFYAVFIWLLSNVFNAFSQKRLFTTFGVRQLSRFYFANFLLPVIAIIITSLLGNDISDAIIIALLHFLLGIFTYFMAAIFTQGLVLQEEQDLTF